MSSQICVSGGSNSSSSRLLTKIKCPFCHTGSQFIEKYSTNGFATWKTGGYSEATFLKLYKSNSLSSVSKCLYSHRRRDIAMK